MLARRLRTLPGKERSRWASGQTLLVCRVSLAHVSTLGGRRISAVGRRGLTKRKDVPLGAPLSSSNRDDGTRRRTRRRERPRGVDDPKVHGSADVKGCLGSSDRSRSSSSASPSPAQWIRRRRSDYEPIQTVLENEVMKTNTVQVACISLKLCLHTCVT